MEWTSYEDATLSRGVRFTQTGSVPPAIIVWTTLSGGAGYPIPGINDVILVNNPDYGTALFTVLNAANEVYGGIEDTPLTINFEDALGQELVITMLRGLPNGYYTVLLNIDTTASTTLLPFQRVQRQFEYELTVLPITKAV